MREPCKDLSNAQLSCPILGGPFTLFAPTDEAFKKISGDAINKLLQNETALIGKHVNSWSLTI